MAQSLEFLNAVYRLKDGFEVTVEKLTLPEHSLTVLIGRNGCGKSTLARAVGGRYELVSGTAPSGLKAAVVSFEDQQQLFEDDYNLRNTDTPDAKEEIGITARELIATGPLTPQIIGALRIGPLLDRPIRTLSGGEGRKILIAKALSENPGLLILDAPFDALDVQSRQALLEIIAYIHVNFALPVLLMVNRAPEIPSCTTQLGIIDNGRICAMGPYETMRNAPQVRALLTQETSEVSDLPQAPARFRVKDFKGDTIVSLKNINITYERPIFRNFTFEVHRGEHYLITGPNGAGKSTLLSLITGDNPLVYVNDVTVFGMKRGSGESIWDVKQYYGYVSASLHLDYRVSSPVINVLLSGFYDSIGLYAHPGDEELKVVHEWLKLTGLEDTAGTSFRALSFGQQRLVLIIRALVKNPPLLILDEPLQGLDGASRAQVLGFISYIMRHGRTSVLFVSHHEEDIPAGITHTVTFVKNAAGGYDIETKCLKKS